MDGLLPEIVKESIKWIAIFEYVHKGAVDISPNILANAKYFYHNPLYPF